MSPPFFSPNSKAKWVGRRYLLDLEVPVMRGDGCLMSQLNPAVLQETAGPQVRDPRVNWTGHTLGLGACECYVVSTALTEISTGSGLEQRERGLWYRCPGPRGPCRAEQRTVAVTTTPQKRQQWLHRECEDRPPRGRTRA